MKHTDALFYLDGQKVEYESVLKPIYQDGHTVVIAGELEEHGTFTCYAYRDLATGKTRANDFIYSMFVQISMLMFAIFTPVSVFMEWSLLPWYGNLIAVLVMAPLRMVVGYCYFGLFLTVLRACLLILFSRRE